MKLTVNKKTEVEVTVQELFDTLVKKLGVDNYVIIDGVLCEYTRTSWTDYDYQPIETNHEGVFIERIGLLDSLKDHINDCINTYTEQPVKYNVKGD